LNLNDIDIATKNRLLLQYPQRLPYIPSPGHDHAMWLAKTSCGQLKTRE